MIAILNERSALLLRELVSKKGFIRISELTTLFNVSNRTIRYDLDNIDEFLKENNLPQIIRKPKVGIGFSELMDDRKKALELCSTLNNRYYILSKNERVNIILSEILKQKDYITIDSIAQLIQVSRGTIIKDLNEVKEWLEKRGLKLITAPKHGIIVDGDEKKIRKAAIELLTEVVDIDKAFDFINSPLLVKNNTVNNQFKNLFDDIDTDYIEKYVYMLEEELQLTFSDEAFSNLMIHICIAVKRIQLGRDIIMPPEELSTFETTKEFAIAEKSIKDLENHFNINIPKDEIGYITIHLLGSSISTTETNEKEDWVKLQIYTGKIISEVSNRINLDLTRDDMLFNGLIEHLRPAINRLKHGLKLKNPVLPQIQNNYQDLFRVIKICLETIEDDIGFGFDDDEIGYITMHFGASIERLIPLNIYKPSVLVVCGTGVGTAKLLSARLKKMFDINIVDTVSYHQVKHVIKEKSVDLIITTVPIDSKEVKAVKVNALLSDEDVDTLRRHLKICWDSRNTMDHLIEIIKNSCNIINYDRLIKDLSGFLNIQVPNNIGGAVQPMLKDILLEDNIKLGVEVNNWEEAIKAGGRLLKANGYIKDEYIDSMINAVKEIGPYIVIAPGIAMPHGRPESGVLKIGLSLITLKNPINFGNKENDPVKIVVCLCAIDHMTHLKALSELVQFLGDEKFISIVLNSKQASEIVNYIIENPVCED